jgi:hypothetical protein
VRESRDRNRFAIRVAFLRPTMFTQPARERPFAGCMGTADVAPIMSALRAPFDGVHVRAECLR